MASITHSEQETARPAKTTEVFNSPNPFDLVSLSATFDDHALQRPPQTYFPAYDMEGQLHRVIEDLKVAYGDHLCFVGLTGSRATHPHKPNTDLDVIAVVDDIATAEKVNFYGDLKIVSLSGLRTFIEHGYQLLTTQFRKAIPLYEKPGALQELQNLQLDPAKALPFLQTKTRFNLQTASIFKLLSDKYRAIGLYLNHQEASAFKQLFGEEQDQDFSVLNAQFNLEGNRYTYVQLAKYYANLGLNRLFHSLSEALQIQHIQQHGDIADVEKLVEWAEEKYPEIGLLYRHIYEKRIACYKRGELLLDSEYQFMQAGVEAAHSLLHITQR